MLERAEISQAGPAIIKYLFAPLEGSIKSPARSFCKIRATDTIVKEFVIAAIERPQAAEKTGVVDPMTRRTARQA